jgi:hypothetical protein
MSGKLYARLKPYSPEKGQPHRQIVLAPLSLRFHEGVFVELPSTIAARLRSYLEEQYPEGDTSRPVLYQICEEAEMLRIVRIESEQAQREKEEALLGKSTRRGGTRSRADDKETFLTERKLSPLEEMASELPPEEASALEEPIGQASGSDVEWGDVAEELENSDTSQKSSLPAPPAEGTASQVKDAAPIKPANTRRRR